MPEKNQAFDVFLSYTSSSSKDKTFASKLAEALRDKGIETWADEAIEPGERWLHQSQKALKESENLVVLLSSDSEDNPWMFFQIGAAVSARKRIIPIVFGNTRLPPLLKKYTVLLNPSPFEAGERVAEVIEKTSKSKGSK